MPKMNSYLVDDNNEHKKAKGVNKNVVGKTTHNEYQDLLLNKRCTRHSMNSIQSKDHIIKMYEMYERFLDLALMMKYTSKTMDVME